ncbi:hypothetical protein [Micromonospora sp. NPDC047074]|uniref:hypothetical protein n=1 Tax=Micromonospora sp. NPDC047074 TaxID=3154339 RepID=UPI00340C7AC7
MAARVDTEVARVDTEVAPVDTEVAPVDVGVPLLGVGIAPAVAEVMSVALVGSVDGAAAGVDVGVASAGAEVASVDDLVASADAEVASVDGVVVSGAPGNGLGVSTSTGSWAGTWPTPWRAAAERPAMAVPRGTSQRVTTLHRSRWVTVRWESAYTSRNSGRQAELRRSLRVSRPREMAVDPRKIRPRNCGGRRGAFDMPSTLPDRLAAR